MKKYIIFYFLVFSLYIFGEEKGKVYGFSDGKGNIKLFWMTSPKVYPEGGWRIEEAKTNKIIEEKLLPAREQYLKLLKEEEKEIAKNFIKIFKDENKEKELSKFVVILKVSTNFNFALGCGFAYELNNVPKGKRSYKIIGLDKNSQITNIVLLSQDLDSSIETPSPSPPENFKAEATLDGVMLTWELSKSKDLIPSVSFNLLREDEVINEKPIMLSGKRGEERAIFIDKNPPLMKEVNYYVYGMDFFGRKSNTVKTKIYIPDFKAMAPPENFIALGGKNNVILKWKKQENASGYIIERSLLYDGPYEIFTPKGIDANLESYEDKNLSGGTVYYYRIHSYGRDGKVGVPSQVAFAQVENAEPPPQPKNLKAKVGRTFVFLTWDRVDFPVAGYRVERRAEGKEKWDRLNEELSLEPEYKDRIGLHTEGKFIYRVIAISHDSQESLPSAEVSVELLDTNPPNPPKIIDIDGIGGKVLITFEPSPPEEDVENFLIIRSVSEDDPGLVIGKPIPKGENTFEDKFVKIGQRYWYRVVALDKKGNRSDFSNAMDISVEPPEIPIPEILGISFKEEPIKHIEIKFKKPEYPFGIVVQKFVDGKWVSISGVIRDSDKFNDIYPKKGVGRYRIFYIIENGVSGNPSNEYEIRLP